MKGLEQAGAAGSGKGAELLGLPIDAPEVQVALALFAYRAAHQQLGVISSEAMNEWVGDPDDKNSFAAVYRTYVEEHPHKRVDTRDDEALEDILTVLAKRREEEISLL